MGVPGQTTVMQSRHADEFRLYSTQGNMILDLSPHARETVELARRSPTMRGHVLDQIAQAQHQLRRLRDRLAEET